MVCQTKYPYFTPLSLAEYTINPVLESCGNPVFNWLAFGKLPENPIVTPSNNTQYIQPSAKNRYLQSVTINPVVTTSLTVTPSTSVQTFTEGYYNPVTVEATA